MFLLLLPDQAEAPIQRDRRVRFHAQVGSPTLRCWLVGVGAQPLEVAGRELVEGQFLLGTGDGGFAIGHVWLLGDNYG